MQAPRQAVWDTLADCERWPQWWRGVDEVEEIDAGDERRVGARYRTVWRGPLPYPVECEFRVETVDEPKFMRCAASGELRGTGEWSLTEREPVTTVDFLWSVETTKAWMSALAPIARPVFVWNHDRIMAAGGEGLAGRLGARLLAHR